VAQDVTMGTELGTDAVPPGEGVTAAPVSGAAPTPVAPGAQASLDDPTLEIDVVTRDGRTMTMRPIAPDDEERLVAFHSALSDESVYLRYFSPHPKLSSIEVYRFTHVDGDRRVAQVVLDGEMIVAVGRYDRLGERPVAEVAFVVADKYQGVGLATLLLSRLAAIARRHGITSFTATTLGSNIRMRKVFADAGFHLHSRFEDGVVTVDFAICEPEPVTDGR
jgi:RimJ/RimL family protein N-acetyltransferase